MPSRCEVGQARGISRSRAVVLGAVALLLPCLASGCHRPAGNGQGDGKEVSPVVARVGGTVITVADVSARLSSLSPFVRARYGSREKKKELLDDMVRFEVLAAEAERRGYDKDPATAHAMKQVLVSALLAHDFETKQGGSGVSDADVEAYYNEHHAEFRQKDMVRASVVVLKDRATAERIAAQAAPRPGQAGADVKTFRDLVLKNSIDENTKANGGDLGFFDCDTTTVPRPIVEAAFGLSDVGAVSAPVETERGVAVVLFAERRPGFDHPLTEVAPDIRQRLLRGSRSQNLDSYIGGLVKSAGVETFAENLDAVPVNGGPTASREEPRPAHGTSPSLPR